MAVTESILSDSCRPRLANGVRLQTDRFTGKPTLLFPEAVVELTGAGTAIVPLCDGARTFGEIIETLAKQFAAPPEVLRADVSRFLIRLRDRMLIDLEESRAVPGPVMFPAADRAEDGPALQMRYRPIGLIAEVSYRCPLHCPYCSNPMKKSGGAAELTTDQWRSVLTQAAPLGVQHALFSGGEPLIRPDLEDLIQHARAAGLYTNLITSAVGLTADRAASLRSAGLDAVQISFQSDQPEMADLIAGTRAHAIKLQAAAIVRDLSFPLTVNVVLHRFNIDRISEIIALAEGLGARRLELASAQYYGWAMQNRTQLLPTRQQVNHASQIAATAGQRLRGKMDVLYVLPDYFGEHPKPCMNGWARQYISVTPLGEVLPCPTAGEIKSMRFENVREKDLRWIWEHSESFNRFRGTDWMPAPCKTCDRREIDFGGCRCQAAMITGDPANTDPVCTFSIHRSQIDAALTAAIESSATISLLVFRTNP